MTEKWNSQWVQNRAGEGSLEGSAGSEQEHIRVQELEAEAKVQGWTKTCKGRGSRFKRLQWWKDGQYGN